MGFSSITTVTVVSTDNDLTDRDTVKAELKITGTTEDSNIDRWITIASKKIATECKREFGARTLSQEFRIDGRYSGQTRSHLRELVLFQRPVNAITSVTENDVALTTDDYEIDAERGLLKRLVSDVPSLWNSGKVTVVYTAGYDLPDEAPEELAQACIRLVAHYRLTATRDPYVKSEQTEITGVLVEQTSWWVGEIGPAGSAGALPPEVKGLIDPFRDNHVA